MTRPAVPHHLRVLPEAKLVRERRDRTRRIYRLDSSGLGSCGRTSTTSGSAPSPTLEARPPRWQGGTSMNTGLKPKARDRARRARRNLAAPVGRGARSVATR